jgi:RecJ-like exonuclease|tara:strand:- start:625 stop:1596 length:972 start_codon:yes stop_codon:yes gene_type:complete
MTGKRKTFCISHGKDVDGIASASLVKMATNAKIYLVNYDKILTTLEKIDDNSEVYVCDLGMNDGIAEEFINECKRITKHGKFTYIDHHILKPNIKRKLLESQITLVHSKNECAGVLTYEYLKKRVPKSSSILACYAAITDYLDNKPIAKSLISNYDRQLLLLESTMLAYALAYDGAKPQFGNKIVSAFQDLKFPHEINNVPELANKQADRMKQMMKKITKEARSYKNFGCMESDSPTIGLVANMIIGELNTPVAFVYRHSINGYYEMSFRARYDSKAKLGKIVSEITSSIGGSGGGHNKACGARIPDDKLNKFIKLFSKQLNE